MRCDGADAVLGQRPAEARGDLVGAGIADRPVGDPVQVRGGLARGEVDDSWDLGGIGTAHGADATQNTNEPGPLGARPARC